MKRLSVLLLIILCATAIASAQPQAKSEVIIYKYMEKSTDHTCDFSGSSDDMLNTLEWEKSNEKETGYFIMQRGAASSTVAYGWHVYTWKAPDKNGKMQKYALMGSYVVYNFNTAHVGDKVSWIVGLGNSDGHFVLKGDEKGVKIKASDKNHDIAKSLTGTHNWYYQEGTIQHAGSSTISLKYHSGFTNDYYDDDALQTGADAAKWYCHGVSKEQGLYIPVM